MTDVQRLQRAQDLEARVAVIREQSGSTLASARVQALEERKASQS